MSMPFYLSLVVVVVVVVVVASRLCVCLGCVLCRVRVGPLSLVLGVLTVCLPFFCFGVFWCFGVVFVFSSVVPFW